MGLLHDNNLANADFIFIECGSGSSNSKTNYLAYLLYNEWTRIDVLLVSTYRLDREIKILCLLVLVRIW